MPFRTVPPSAAPRGGYARNGDDSYTPRVKKVCGVRVSHVWSRSMSLKQL